MPVDKEGDAFLEAILKIVSPELAKKLEEALTEVTKKARFFTDFTTLSRYILASLEEYLNLSEEAKEKLYRELLKIYRKTQFDVNPLAYEFNTADERAIRYALRLHDFYLGKFFRGDREIRLRAARWMSRYYLEKGNPIGKGQKGIKEFLEEFGSYLKPQTEWKARQIIDTSVNYLRNSARIRAMQKARVKLYRIDAIGDRLTCRICRSLDGRIVKVEEAVRVLDMLETTQDPTLLKELKPILKEPFRGKTSELSNKFPPFHPHCRCKVVIEEEEKYLPTTVLPVGRRTPVQEELLEEYKALTPEEVSHRIKAHLSADWLRPVRGEKGVNAYRKAKRDLERHFKKHGKEFGFETLEEYKKGAYEVIEKPEEVYVSRKDGETFYYFRRGDRIVIVDDDNLAIKTFYRLNKPLEEWLRDVENDGLIRIL